MKPRDYYKHPTKKKKKKKKKKRIKDTRISFLLQELWRKKKFYRKQLNK